MHDRAMTRLLANGLLVSLLLGATVAAPARAGEDDEIAVLKKQVIEAKAQRLELEAEQDVLKLEKQHPPAAPSHAPVKLPPGAALGVPETLQDILGEGADLRETQEKRAEALKKLEDEAGKRQGRAKECWEKAGRESLQVLDDLAAEEASLWVSVARIGPELRVEWDEPRRWLAWDGPTARTAFWFWCLATFSACLAARETRLGRRRWWRARGPFVRGTLRAGLKVFALAWVLLLAWIVASLVVFRIPPAGAAPGSDARAALANALRAEAARLQDAGPDVAALKKEVEGQRESAYKEWTAALGLPAKSPLEERERAAGKRLHDVLVQTQAATLFATEGAEAAERARSDRARLVPAVEAKRRTAPLWAAVRLAMSGGLVLLAFVPPLVFLRRRRRRRRVEAEQCPRCLDRGKLVVVTTAVRDERYPDSKYLRCPICEYEMRLGYRHLPRLCFPTVGRVGSGKTHWLVETYSQIDEQRVHSRAKLTKAPSLGDRVLDELVRRLREEYRGPHGTTVTEGMFPYPFTLHFQDLDPSPSRVMLNLFDFGGEMTSMSIDTSKLRRRALLMDGFVFFLDPTQSVKEQQAILKLFAEEMRALRDLKPEVPIHLPVAVCLSKLDLLPSQTAFSGRARPWLRRLRATAVGPATLATLEDRSRLAREALVTLFPGLPIEKDLRDTFGENFLFFPLTPVGLADGELEGPAVADLRRRAVEPFGIAEPILWLLHRHGYRVFG